MNYGSGGMDIFGSAGMDIFITEDRKTMANTEFEGMPISWQRRSTWSSLGNAIRQGIRRNR